ncbi:MAG: hypothetical protein ACI4HQ_12080 [Acetatifactor sp.]
MKKSMIKLAVFFATFLVALIVIGKIMNKGHDNMTMEMAPASFPLVTMNLNGENYNQLHGYSHTMDTAFQRETVTMLGEGRKTGFTVRLYGRNVTGVSFEVRSVDGSRLIENTAITDYVVDKDTLSGILSLKDLIEQNTEYSLSLILELDGSEKIYYYTRVIWSESYHAEEKLAYVLDFHRRLYNREAARELTKYLEPNAKLEDNSSFHKVNIHSSFWQITWGELNVTEVSEPEVKMTDITEQTASFLVDYIVSTYEGKEITYYTVEEAYRIRYSTERMYLLDYERTMTQLPETKNMYANDKIMLGIVDVEVPMLESEGGSIIVFESANKLFSYNVSTNSLIEIFGFYNGENADARTIYNNHSVKILDVDEGGNVYFAVYGYMNRGRHEGEVGVQVCAYNSSLNTTEELLYIDTNKSYAVLKAELDQLMYMNRDGFLYLRMNDAVYGINLEEQSYTKMVEVHLDEGIRVSDNHRIIIWPEGEDVYAGSKLNISNLSINVSNTVFVDEDESVLPLGFMNEDIIYGVAKKADVIKENSGRTFFPMYKICICDSSGKLLKEYSQPDIYVTDCYVEENQIVLERVERQEDGTYKEIYEDHITNNSEAVTHKNVIAPADIDIYERYVQIKVYKEIDSKTIKILTPKEVVHEGEREFLLPEEKSAKYYVYGSYGIEGIYYAPSKAVNLASEIAGVVTDENGMSIWRREKRVTKNQIMAIKEPTLAEPGESLAVCLDAVFALEGLVRNSEYLLAQGETVLGILEENMEGIRVLDMTGCSLDSMLYYVNRDIPVLVLLENGEAVLITGFNDRQIVIMEPSSGMLYKKNISDSVKWFEENGNCFITYMY